MRSQDRHIQDLYPWDTQHMEPGRSKMTRMLQQDVLTVPTLSPSFWEELIYWWERQFCFAIALINGLQTFAG